GITSMTIPKITFVLIILLCTLLISKDIFKIFVDKNEKKIKAYLPTISKKTLLVMVFIFGYAFIWDKLGFILSTIIFSLATSFFLSEKRSYLKQAAISIFF